MINGVTVRRVEARIRYQHADAKMQSEVGWSAVPIMGLRRGYVPPPRVKRMREKTRRPERSDTSCQISRDMNRYGRRDAHVQGELTIARQPGGFVQECTFPLCISGTVRTLYHISSRVWCRTCSNKCLARYGFQLSSDGHSVRPQ